MLVSRDGNAEASCSTQTVIARSPEPPSQAASNSFTISHALPSSSRPIQSSSRHTRNHPIDQLDLPPYARYLIHSPSDSSSSSSSKPTIVIPPKFHSMTAGAGAGLVSSIVTCPLDVIKTRLQAQLVSKDAGYEGVEATIKRIWQQSGLRGFYRGLGPTLGGYLPTWGIYFTVYDLVKDRLGDIAKQGSHPNTDTTVLHIFAAMTAGATGTIMTNPLWVVKTRFMAQAVLPPSAARYRNTLEAVTSIYRTEGFGAFYKGLLPSLLGVSHVAIQFPIYEAAKAWADPEGNHSSLSPATILSCSAFSKMIASLVTYPHEVLRTRLQIANPQSSPVFASSSSSSSSSTASSSSSSPSPSPSSSASSTSSSSTKPLSNVPKLPPLPTSGPTPLYSPLVTGSNPPLPLADAYTNNRIAAPGNGNGNGLNTAKGLFANYKPKRGGIIDTALKIKRQDGWRGFYRGLSINLVRTVPNSAVTMLSYELIMRRLSSTQQRSQQS